MSEPKTLEESQRLAGCYEALAQRPFRFPPEYAKRGTHPRFYSGNEAGLQYGGKMTIIVFPHKDKWRLAMPGGAELAWGLPHPPVGLSRKKAEKGRVIFKGVFRNKRSPLGRDWT